MPNSYYFMQRLLLCSGLLLSFNYLISQSVIVGHNSTSSGRSISVDYAWAFKKSEIGVGIGININRFREDHRIDELYFKKLHADEIHEYFAIKGYYHKYLFKRENYNIYAFYDLQIRYSGAKSQIYPPVGYDPSLIVYGYDDGIIYQSFTVNYGTYTWLENTIGGGIDIFLNEDFAVRYRIGLGMLHTIGEQTDGNIIMPPVKVNGVAGYLMNAGIIYRIRSKE